MTISVENITGGPASLLLATTRISHTHGGVKVKVSPKTRMRTVDEYGSIAVDVIHTGDDVQVTAPLAEWTADTLKHVYAAGNDQTGAGGAKYIGIGRSAGFIHVCVPLSVVPLLAADAAKKCDFYRATPVGEFELNHVAEDDRIFNVQFACIGDPEGDDGDTDGQIIGKIQLAAGS